MHCGSRREVGDVPGRAFEQAHRLDVLVRLDEQAPLALAVAEPPLKVVSARLQLLGGDFSGGAGETAGRAKSAASAALKGRNRPASAPQAGDTDRTSAKPLDSAAFLIRRPERANEASANPSAFEPPGFRELCNAFPMQRFPATGQPRGSTRQARS